MSSATLRALTSTHAACVWIPLFALRAEERRKPELNGKLTAVLSAEDSRRLWQVSPHARHVGVKPGMTVSQAIGLCPTLTLLEADPVHPNVEGHALVAEALSAAIGSLRAVAPRLRSDG